MADNASLSSWNPMQEDHEENVKPQKQEKIDLYVKGIPPTLTDAALKNLFSPHGEILRARCMDPKKPEWPKAGFVCFKRRKSADEAIKHLNGYKIGKFYLQVQVASGSTSKPSARNFNSKPSPAEIKASEKTPIVEADIDKLVDDVYKQNHPNLKKAAKSQSTAKSSDAGDVTNTVVGSKIQSGSSGCVVCKKTTKRKCTGCSGSKVETFYCSRTCQANNWPEHSKDCKTAQTKMASTEDAVGTDKDDGFMVCISSPKVKDCKKILKTFNEGGDGSNEKTPQKNIGPSSAVLKGTEVNLSVTGFRKETKQIFARVDERESSRSVGELEKSLQQIYSTNNKEYAIEALDVGDFCMSLTFNQCQPVWRRAIVEEVVKSNVYRVFCLDYGVSEKCTIVRLRAMDKKFCSIKALSLKCDLGLHGDEGADAPWDDSIIKFLRTWLESCKFAVKAKIVDINGVNARVEFVNAENKSLKSDFQHFMGRDEKPKKTHNDPVSPSKAHSQSFVYKKVDVPCDTFDVIVTHVISPDRFYCQVFGDGFVKLKYQQTKIGKKFAPENLAALEKLPRIVAGAACIAQSPDDKSWYRAIVRKVEEQVTVQLVDYGKIVKISKQLVYSLPSEFQQLPAQSFKAALGECHANPKWSSEAIDYMKGKCGDIFSAELMEHSPNVALLALSIDCDETVNNILVERGWASKKAAPADAKPNGSVSPRKTAAVAKQNVTASPQRTVATKPNNSVSPRRTIPAAAKPSNTASSQKTVSVAAESNNSVSPRRTIPAAATKTNSTVSSQKSVIVAAKPKSNESPSKTVPDIELPKGNLTVAICHVESPSAFWFQLVGDNIHKLCEQQDKLTEEFSDLSAKNITPLRSFVVGQTCAAKFNEDEMWYRARIISITDKVKIQFIDYGNFEFVSAKEVYDLPEKFMKIPAQAVKATLANCFPASGEKWGVEATAMVEDHQNLPLRAKVTDCLSKNNCKSVKVDVFVDGDESLNSLLVKKGLATDVTKKEEPVDKTSEDSPRGKRSDADSKSNPKPAVHQNEEVSESTSKFVKQNGETSQNTSKINVQQNVGKAPPKQTVVAEQHFPDEEFSVLVTHVNSPTSFFCQIVSENLLNLGKQQELLAEMFSNRPPAQTCFAKNLCLANPGNVCVAQFTDDDMWYRAKIIKVSHSRNLARVQFIDYGNVDTVSLDNIYPLPSEFLDSPAQAVEAALAVRFPEGHDKWTQDVTDLLSRYKDQILDASKTAVQSGKPPVLDILVSDTGSLSAVLIDSGLARALPKSSAANVEKSPTTANDVVQSSDAHCSNSSTKEEDVDFLNKTFSGFSLTRDNDNTIMDDHSVGRNVNVSRSNEKAGPRKVRRPSTPSVLESNEIVSESNKRSLAKSSASPTNSLPNFRRVEVPLGRVVEVKISNSDESGKFTCHIVNDQLDAMCDLVDDLTELFSKPARKSSSLLKDFNSGTRCAAFHLSTSTWQRAVILKESPNQVKVCYVDRGGCGVVDKVQVCRLPEEYFALPALAVACVLADAKPVASNWAHSLVTLLKEYDSKAVTGLFVNKIANTNVFKVKIPAILNDLIVQKVAVYSID